MRPDAPAPSVGQAHRLDAGLLALGLTLNPTDQTRILGYLDLLAHWNRVYNLTAIRDPEQMLIQHLLDSLAVVPVLERWFPEATSTGGIQGPSTQGHSTEGHSAQVHSTEGHSAQVHSTEGQSTLGHGTEVQGQSTLGQSTQAQSTGSVSTDGIRSQGLSLVDVGSGAGLPGLMLALARPHWQVDMVEPVGKKSAFIQQSIGELGLRNARSLGARVEQLRLASPGQPRAAGALSLARAPTFLISRAFSSLATFAQAGASILGPDTRLVAMKGRLPEQEIAELPSPWRVDQIETLKVPGLAAERHLILLSRSH